MYTAFAPSFPDLVSSAIRQLVSPDLGSQQWRLVAAACSDQLFWVKMEVAGAADRQMMIGLPIHVVQGMMSQLNEAGVRAAWNEPEARMIELEQLSRSLPNGTHKLVIAPITVPYFREIRVTVLY